MALPRADTDMMQLHLDEISRNVAMGAHAVLLLDRAGWHITGKLDVPDNITPIFLPSRAPELPGRECLAVSPSELAFKHRLRNYDAIIDAACAAWRKLIANPKPSHPSECATGRMSVSRYDLWDNSADRNRRHSPSAMAVDQRFSPVRKLQ